MTTYSDLLRDIDLGNGAAEQDRLLENVFIPTADFRHLQGDKCDLITGIKGSGKSALFLMLLRREGELKHVVLAPAQNTVGPPVLQQHKPPKPLETDDDYYALRWSYHTTAIAGNELVHRYRHVLDVSSLEVALEEIGLKVETRPGIDEAWRLSGALAERVIADQPGAREAADHALRSVLALLEGLGHDIWVLYDRLDEAFGSQEERERAVLRGLLQAQINILRFGGRLKVKVFVRHDLYDHVTRNREGLRNLDYLRRLKLNMTARELAVLVGRRALNSTAYTQHLSSLSALDRSAIEAPLQASWWLLPTPKETGPKSPPENVYRRLFLLTSDSSNSYSPRNVINMLALALLSQQRLADRDGLEVPTQPPLVTERAVDAAWHQYSEDRLGNYVLAEFAEVRPLIERLRHKQRSFRNLKEFAALLEVDREAARESVDALKYCGVLRELTNGRLEVADLYRPALQSKKPRSRVQGRETS